MSDGMTTNQLIEYIEQSAMVPINQATFTQDNMIQFLTQELQLRLTTLVRSVHEDFLLFTHAVPLEQNKFKYPIPSRAHGNILRDVQFKTSDNNYHELTRVGIGDRPQNGNDWSAAYPMVSGLRRVYVENSKVVIISNGTPGLQGSYLDMIFYIRPARLVTDDAVAIITDINTTTGEITVDQIPSTYTTQAKYDFYKGTTPFSVVKIDFTVASINPTTKTITIDPSELPDDLEVGDHFPLAGQAIYPQVPCELHSMLCQLVICKLLEAQGDQEGLVLAQAKLAEMKQSLDMFIDDRIEDAPRKLVNRFSLVRLSSFSKYWGS